MFRLKEGTLYPILHTLEKEKLVTVRAVRRQIKGLRSGITEQLTYRLDMVSPEVVHYHNIAGPEGGNQNLFQIVQEFVCCCSTLKSRKRHCSLLACTSGTLLF